MELSAVHPTVQSRFLDVRESLQKPVLAALAYYLGAQIAFLIGTLSDKIFAPLWPPNVVLFCVLLVTPPRRWWIYIVAVLPAHFAAELGVDMTVPQILVAFATNCMVALANAWAVRWLIGGPPWFGSLRGTAIYIVVTAVASPALFAFGGAFVQILGGGSIDKYALYWAYWYASNALGSLTLGPVAMIWLSEDKGLGSFVLSRRHIEVALLAVALVVTCTIAFDAGMSVATSGYLPTLLYLPLPLILWSALRFGVKGASRAILVISLVLIWRALNGPNLFTIGSAESNVFALQIFLIGLSAPTLLLGAAIDEARRAERLTRESEARMAFAAASSNLGLWQYDLANREFWTTDYCRTMFGLPDDARVDLDMLLRRVHPDDFKLVMRAMTATLRRHIPMSIEFRLCVPGNPDGAVRWISAHARENTDKESNTRIITGAFADVTSRKAAEADAAARRHEIAHLMRVSMLGELSGGLAHELTQPLTAILSNAQAGKMLLAQGRRDMREIGNIFDDIITEDNRAGDVIHRLRGMLKKDEVRYEAVDINRLIVSTLQLLHSEVISRRITIISDLAADLAPARGDPVQLQQILLNLLMNAMDAMDEVTPARRTINVATAKTPENEVEVRISDRGAGLPLAQERSVFQPFFTTKKRGLGLGLSICSSIIKSHGGALSVQNNDDEGATAVFRLPNVEG
jgi:PAS domain S-box-containing protein